MTAEPERHTQRFAWDGLSFDVPADWNLSDYAQRSDLSWVRFQDDTALRLEVEWRRTRLPMDVLRIRRQYAAPSEALVKEGANLSIADGLPAGWSAYLYSMPDGRRLLTAFWLSSDALCFVFFKLHFAAASRREPLRMIRALAAGFRVHAGATIPWAAYDFGFRLNREFRLTYTSFQAGRKMMAFEWRRRRFFIWYFSLPDLFLKDRAPEPWCAEFLNGFKAIRGVRFEPGAPGQVRARYTWRRPFGHGEAVARGCFRYDARCRLLPDRRQLVLTVYQHRRPADLESLRVEPAGLGAPDEP